MKFTFETQYNAKTMTVMARALRKTVRKHRSIRSHLLGWIVAVLALLLLLSKGFVLDPPAVITVLAVLAMVLVLLLEDRINGYAAKKRLLPGTERAVTAFSEEGFSSSTEAGTSEWSYDRIMAMAESGGFFVLIFSASHAQLYDMGSLRGGTADEFRRFMEGATGKQVQRV